MRVCVTLLAERIVERMFGALRRIGTTRNIQPRSLHSLFAYEHE